MRSNSNLGRTCQIGRLRSDWGAGGGAGSPETRSRGGAAPEKGNWGLPDSVWARVWSWRASVERVNHLATQERGLGSHAARCGEGRRWVAGELRERSSAPDSGWFSRGSAPAWHGLAS